MHTPHSTLRSNPSHSILHQENWALFKLFLPVRHKDHVWKTQTTKLLAHFSVIHQLWLSALHLPQREAVQEGRTQALSPWETLESHHFFPSETLDTSFPLHNHKKSHPGGILFPPSQLPITSTDAENHRSCKDHVSVLFHLSTQTRPVPASLPSAPRNNHTQQVLAPLEEKSGELFPKNMQSQLFSGSWVVPSLPAQASGQGGPRHTPPKHSPSRRQKSNSSGSQTWAWWLSSPSPEASLLQCALPGSTYSAGKSSCKVRREKKRCPGEQCFKWVIPASCWPAETKVNPFLCSRHFLAQDLSLLRGGNKSPYLL